MAAEEFLNRCCSRADSSPHAECSATLWRWWPLYPVFIYEMAVEKASATFWAASNSHVFATHHGDGSLRSCCCFSVAAAADCCCDHSSCIFLPHLVSCESPGLFLGGFVIRCSAIAVSASAASPVRPLRRCSLMTDAACSTGISTTLVEEICMRIVHASAPVRYHLREHIPMWLVEMVPLMS